MPSVDLREGCKSGIPMQPYGENRAESLRQVMILFSHQLCCFGSRCALRLLPHVHLNCSMSCATRASYSWRLDLSGNATRRLARTACAASRDMLGFECQNCRLWFAGGISCRNFDSFATPKVMLSPTGYSMFLFEWVTRAVIGIQLALIRLQPAHTHLSCKDDQSLDPLDRLCR